MNDDFDAKALGDALSNAICYPEETICPGCGDYDGCSMGCPERQRRAVALYDALPAWALESLGAMWALAARGEDGTTT